MRCLNEPSLTVGLFHRSALVSGLSTQSKASVSRLLQGLAILVVLILRRQHLFRRDERGVLEVCWRAVKLLVKGWRNVSEFGHRRVDIVHALLENIAH